MSYYIVSLNSETVHQVAERLQVSLSDIKEVQGKYKGELERAFVVNYSVDQRILEGCCMADGQLAYLSVDGRGGSTLYSLDGYGYVPSYLGLMRQVSSTVALKRDSWTFDPVHKNYWCVF